MKTKNRFRSIMAIVGVSAIALVGLTACSTVATPIGMCGWIVGDGSAGNDRKIHDTVYENENPTIPAGQEAQYVPCGPRNWRVTDGTKKDSAGNPVGDQTTPYIAYTVTNTPVLVQVDAEWQLNQDKTAFTSFKELCNKYQCYTTDASIGSANFATPGWNGMLNENFGPSVETALKIVMKQVPDSIWSDHDPEVTAAAEKALAAQFMETVRLTTGYSENLFCGSGNSGWNNEASHDSFTCSNVRFVIRDVSAQNPDTQSTASAQSEEELKTAANQARYNSSFPLYGDQTGYWLGVQDAAKACPTGSTCNIYIGNAVK